MATQTKTDPITESVETAAQRVAELNEKAVANGKKAGAAYVSTYEKTVLSLADSYEKAAGATKVYCATRKPDANAALAHASVKPRFDDLGAPRARRSPARHRDRGPPARGACDRCRTGARRRRTRIARAR